MSSSKCPVAVLLISCLYIVVGAVGFAYHFSELMGSEHYSVWIELTELLAVLCGAFMLCGRNWARWLALVWMAFHVVISFPIVRQVAIHSLFLVVIAWLLFRPDAMKYFSSTRPQR